MKAEYEFTVKIKVVREVDSVMDLGDLTTTTEEAMHFICDRMVDHGFITAFEFIERKMEAKVDE